MNNTPQPGRPSRAYREGAPIFKYRPPERPTNPDEVRPGELCLQEYALRELILAARVAANFVTDFAGLKRDIPEVKRLLAACKLVEKAARKRAVDMRPEK